MEDYDSLIIGAGAAGLMCAIEAGKRGRKVLVLEGSNKPGKKILMSGGGRCNFTNLRVGANNFISHQANFCKAALKRYKPKDFIALVEKHQIPFHEKTLGQLFCDNKSKDILNMLLTECEQANVTIKLNCAIQAVKQLNPEQFEITTEKASYRCQSLVIATGGLSIPTLGSSPFGYKIAEQFGLNVWPTRAGLVPFTLHDKDKQQLAPLAGIAITCSVSCNKKSFSENLLFTHRGLSGPAMLQISSYWQPGDTLTVNLLPGQNLSELLFSAKQTNPAQLVKNYLATLLPKRLVEAWLSQELQQKALQECSKKVLQQLSEHFQHWQIKPNNTEGYRTAEVTLGGVDCSAICPNTFSVKSIPNLYFIGEVLDVTGWLGGYNFAWAWASGFCAGQVA